jgi:hypothetical protein
MRSGGVLVHCPSGLGAAATVLAAELPCGDGVFAEWAVFLSSILGIVTACSFVNSVQIPHDVTSHE